MSFELIPTPPFEKELKQLAKKYPSVKKDILSLSNQLSDNPFIGTSLGNNCYKIRMAISSKHTGKSGGARIITCVKIVKQKIYLLAIYDKSKQEIITDEEILLRLKGL
jgi:mRNA-degrading endonuclease RelE of RelBE toxin-antitoxin system